MRPRALLDVGLVRTTTGFHALIDVGLVRTITSNQERITQ